MRAERKYHPLYVDAQSWSYIEKRYIEDWQGKHNKMLELVRHIRNSDLQHRLYGVTSMDKLIVSIYDPIDYQKEALHIRFDLWNQKWHFEYIAIPYQEPELVRSYDKGEGIAKFDNFIGLMKW